MARKHSDLKAYFKLLQTGFKYQKRHSDIKEFRRSVLCSIGWVKEVRDEHGNTFLDAESLSYTTCNESQFKAVYAKTVSYFIETLAINESILAELSSYQ